MIICFIPIVPIIIFVFLLASGIVGELLSVLNTIHIILGVLIGIAFFCIFVYVLKNAADETRKIASAILAVASCIVSLLGLDFLISSLSAIEHSFFMVFEFAFVGIVGGALLLALVMGALILCLNVSGN